MSWTWNLRINYYGTAKTIFCFKHTAFDFLPDVLWAVKKSCFCSSGPKDLWSSLTRLMLSSLSLSTSIVPDLRIPWGLWTACGLQPRLWRLPRGAWEPLGHRPRARTRCGWTGRGRSPPMASYPCTEWSIKKNTATRHSAPQLSQLSL